MSTIIVVLDTYDAIVMQPERLPYILQRLSMYSEAVRRIIDNFRGAKEEFDEQTKRRLGYRSDAWYIESQMAAQ